MKPLASGLCAAAILLGLAGCQPALPVVAPPPPLSAVAAATPQPVTDAAIVDAIKDYLGRQQPAQIGPIASIEVQQPFADNADLYTFHGTTADDPNGGSTGVRFMGSWRKSLGAQGIGVIKSPVPGTTGELPAADSARQVVASRIMSAPAPRVIEGLDVKQLQSPAPHEVLVFTGVTVDADQRWLQQGIYAPGATVEFQMIGTPLSAQ